MALAIVLHEQLGQFHCRGHSRACPHGEQTKGSFCSAFNESLDLEDSSPAIQSTWSELGPGRGSWEEAPAAGTSPVLTHTRSLNFIRGSMTL